MSLLPPDLVRRFPSLTAEGLARLQWLTEHPHAPRFTHAGVNRLNVEALQRIQAFAYETQTPTAWLPTQWPPWLLAFAKRCYADVPFYRRAAPLPQHFQDIPTTDRADLAREPWAFVPDAQPLDDLLIYNTSGTTGHPLAILSQPETAAKYLPLLNAALAPYEIALPTGSTVVAAILVCYQRFTFTYASVSAVLDQAGFVKLNLHPTAWRHPEDRVHYLEACDPAIYTGDPLSFSELAQLPLKTKPKVLISTALTLTPGLRQQLEAHFHCPVLDLYSMNETGPIAVAEAKGYRLLQPHLYVEILDPLGSVCPEGVRGEVVVSGGFNPFLPLLRYRTGDYAALQFQGSTPYLTDLIGRAPIRFRALDGTWLNNIDISVALRPYPLVQFHLHQFNDGTLRLTLWGAEAHHEAIRQTMLTLFGEHQSLQIDYPPEPPALAHGKTPQYTSDLI